MIKGTLNVAGISSTGVIRKSNSFSKKDYFFVCKKPDISMVKQIIQSKGLIYESGGRTDHINVMCRVIGIPTINLKAADELLKEGKIISVNGQTGEIFLEPREIRLKVKKNPEKIIETLKNNSIRLQLSIVNELDVIRAQKMNTIPIDQFFLRNEFLWIQFNKNPFEFLGEYGEKETIDIMEENIEKIVQQLDKNQLLNFRSLDLRSDEFSIFSANQNIEPNPQMGLHGIRQLLIHRNFLICELKAVDNLYSKGYANIVFSVPFITNLDEFREIKRILTDNCRNKIKLGVFIELPSAVSELEYLLDEGVDFVYVGTKDLVQFICGCDRTNELVSHLYNTKSLAVREAITHIIDVSKKFNKNPFVFVLQEDIDYFTKEFKYLKNISICTGELVNLVNRENERLEA